MFYVDGVSTHQIDQIYIDFASEKDWNRRRNSRDLTCRISVQMVSWVLCPKMGKISYKTWRSLNSPLIKSCDNVFVATQEISIGEGGIRNCHTETQAFGHKRWHFFSAPHPPSELRIPTRRRSHFQVKPSRSINGGKKYREMTMVTKHLLTIKRFPLNR